MVERRQFSGAMKGKNLRYLNDHEGQSVRARAGFLLLEHFSLPAFTQALDTIVTANLLRPELFRDLELARHGLQVVPYGGGVSITSKGDILGNYTDQGDGKIKDSAKLALRQHVEP